MAKQSTPNGPCRSTQQISLDLGDLGDDELPDSLSDLPASQATQTSQSELLAVSRTAVAANNVPSSAFSIRLTRKTIRPYDLPYPYSDGPKVPPFCRTEFTGAVLARSTYFQITTMPVIYKESNGFCLVLMLHFTCAI